MYQLCFLSHLSSSEWAAWIQAIGSILAIAVAILVARHSTRANHELVRSQLAAQRQEWSHARRLRYGELLGPSIALLERLLHELEARRQETLKLFEPDQYSLPSDFLAHSSELVKEIVDIRAASMPSPIAAVNLLRARLCAQEALKAVQKMVTDKNVLLDPMENNQEAITVLNHLQLAHSSLVAEHHRLLTENTDADAVPTMSRQVE